MKLMPSRRQYRRIFRRVRVYLPVVAVALLLMLAFLPLSAPWMARRFESEILKRFGMTVQLQRLEIQLAGGRIEAFGLTLPGSKAGDEPFKLDYVAVEGSLAGLLGGGERFPDRIVVSSPPPIRLEHDADGKYRLVGGFQTLLSAVTPLVESSKGTPASAKPSSNKVGRTPEVELENVRLFAEPPDPSLPPIEIVLSRVRVQARSTAASPVFISMLGSATAAATERFALYGTLHPDSDRIELSGNLEGIGIPFQIPALGGFAGRARGVTLDATLHRATTGIVDGTLRLGAERFELSRARIGGERWQDNDIEAQLRYSFDPAKGHLDVGELSVFGEQVDVAMRGDITLVEGLPGDASVVINKLPGGLLTLGRNELMERLRVSFEPQSTSSTLRLEASARGHFADPASLDSQAFVTMRGWRLALPQLPQPIDLNNATLLAGNDAITVRRLDLAYDNLNFSAYGGIPFKPGDDGLVSLTLSGEADSAVRLLGELGALPPEISSVQLPVRLKADIPFSVSDSGLTRLTTETLRLEADWGAGQLVLSRFPDSIRVEPGSVRLDAKALAIQRLRIESRGVMFSATGKLHDPWALAGGAPPRFEGNVVSSGRIEDAIFLATRMARLPRLPAGLGGRYQLEGDASALQGDLDLLGYTGRLLIEDGTAVIPTPYRLVPLSGVTLDLSVSNDLVELRRGALTIVDQTIGDSRVEFSLRADEKELRADATVRSRFEYVSALLARDLSDLVMEGPLPATAWATARPGQPLPQGPDLIRRWVAYLSKPGLTVGITGNPDLMLDYEARYTQEAPITLFARELPVTITNVRGGASFTPADGISFPALEADVGSARGARISGNVFIGKPTTIRLNVDLDHLDVNEWLDGWGQRPWASKPIAYVPRWKSNPNPVQFVQVEANVTAKSIDFMQFKGAATSTKLEVQAWSRRPALLWLRDMNVDLYGGHGIAKEMSFVFPVGERPIMKTDATLEDVELKGFMDALYERPQAMDGLLSGVLQFSGQLLNYPTYQGEGTYRVSDTGVIGNVFLTYWREFLQTNSTTGGRDGSIKGAVDMADQKVHFRDMRIFSPVVNVTADGNVDFRGRLDFDITASVISKRLHDIPVISIVGDVWDMIGRQIISYRLEGTLKSPKYFPVPTVVTRLQAMRDFVSQTTSSAMQPRSQP
ncbi:hypothetical protein GC173_15180 [bacterium]|nr:hypothetical protein [bacterium]